MSANKIVLLAVAIVAVGIFALPSTVSLFSGQHTWYNLNGAGNQVPCEKCHADIQAEMVSGDNGVHLGLAGPGCDCHRVNSTQVQKPTGVASGDGNASTPGTKSHAAETIACMVCHEYGNSYPHAGGFSNKTDSPYYYGSDAIGRNGTKAAHNAFIQDAIDDPMMEDSNEACIACHTRVGVNITWVKNENMVFQAVENASGDWNVSKFAAGGSNTTTVNTSNAWTQ
ncbi:MAG: hypothetical protein WAV32_05995 [Halobacteriota archaeon]